MSAHAMNISINNNRKLLSRRERLKNKLGGFDANKKTEYNLPKATTKQLNDIKKQLKEEEKIRFLKILTLTFVLFLVLVCAFIYSADGIIKMLQY